LKKMSLMSVGERAVVEKMGESRLEKRLRELGLCEGAEICCMGRSPLGDPSAYLISGALIALRRGDTENIIIKAR